MTVPPFDFEWPIGYADDSGGVTMRFRVLIEQDEEGMYMAECPSLPGCISQGKTYHEAQHNVQEAIQGYLESLKKHKEAIPPPIREAIVDVKISA